MTVQQILAAIEEHNLPCSFARIGGSDARWACRIGALQNMRLAEGFEACVLAAWAAYIGGAA